MSNENEHSLTQKQNKLTIEEYDLKSANLILDKLNEFFTPPTLKIPLLSNTRYFSILLDAFTAMKMNYGPRPEVKK